MKIKNIKYHAFGPFTEQHLDLGGTGLVVLYGANEAGKSSALRGLKSWLFGFSKSPVDNFLHENKKLRISGVLESRAGDSIEFIRRKGAKKNLLAKDGKTIIPDSTLQAFLGDVTSELFDTLFGITHADLIKGGEALLREDGEVGKALFSASLGNKEIQDLLAELDEHAQALYKPRGSTQVLARAVAEYEKAKAQEKKDAIAPADYERIQNSFDQINTLLEDREEELIQKRAKLIRLEKIKQVIPLVNRHEQISKKRSAMGEVLVLAEDFSKRRERIEENARLLGEKSEASTSRLELLEQQLAAINLDESLLQDKHQIIRTQQRLVQLESLQQSLESWRATRNRLEGELESLEGQLNDQKINQKTGDFRRLLAQRPGIEQLVQQRSGLLGKKQSIIDQQEDNASELAAASAAIKGTNTLRLDALQSQLKLVTGLGDIDHQIDVQTAKLRQLDRETDAAFKRLPLWEDSLEALRNAALPMLETIDQFDERFQSSTVARSSISEKIAETQRFISEQQERIEALKQQGDLPTEAQLRKFRGQRDQAWELLQQVFAQPESENSQPHGLDAKIDAVDQGIQRADELADRLRSEADRVQQHIGCVAQLKRLEQRRSEQEEGLRECEQQANQIQTDWEQLWSKVKIDLRNPAEMRQWLAGASRVIESADRRDEAVGIRKHMLDQRHSSLDALRKVLQTVGEDPDLGDRIGSWIDYAERLIKANLEQRQQQEVLRRSIAQLELQQERLKSKSVQTDTDLELWQERWAEVMIEGGMDKNLPPEDLLPLLGIFTRIDQVRGEMVKLDKEIAEAEKEIESFKADVDFLMSQHLPDFVYEDPAKAVAQLAVELEKAQEAYASIKTLRNRQQEELKSLEDTRLAMAENDIAIRHLCQEASCNRQEDLAAQDEKSRQARALDQEMANLQSEIDRLLEYKVAEYQIEAWDSEELAAEIDALSDNIKDSLEPEVSDLTQKKGELKKELEFLDHGAMAAEAAEAAEAALASIQAAGEEYMRYKIAAQLLRVEIERFRQANQKPLITRAGELFKKLTVGAFQGLDTEFGSDDELVLTGIRAGSGESVTVEGMSSGTRDQLYLALRLATLEHFLSADEEPMPVIVDDILIEFDEARTEAALRTLLEFSRQTQVLLFTHHQHVVDAAERAGRQDVQFVTLSH
ncbi:MAG: AAA family ATPase [Thiotrichales bacterium]